MQEGRPIAFFSKALAPRTLGLLTYEKEMLTIIHVVALWPRYLLGRHFMQGKENVAADALSRIPEGALQHISGPLIGALDNIQKEVLQDSELRPIVEALRQKQDAPPGVRLQNKHLYFHDRVVIPSASPWKNTMLQVFHSSPMWGIHEFYVPYSGSEPMFSGKVNERMSRGLLTHLEIAQQIWDTVSMDFIDGLPRSQGNFLAVGSMDPAIEIWDLDLIEELQPSVVLGGVSKKKKKGNKKGTIASTEVKITVEIIQETFTLSPGKDVVELSDSEIKEVLQVMHFSREKPIHLKIDLSEEYRFLVNIVGKVLISKISAYDVIPRAQLPLMGLLVLGKRAGSGLRCPDLDRFDERGCWGGSRGEGRRRRVACEHGEARECPSESGKLMGAAGFQRLREGRWQ
ncbi:hypothetical protein KSP39_PZI023921 [Platanthera zijinensis]|uniref:Reverse transcriptase RNase H-like domain-containing protein n=1 Tax=Platanthera zijinensis TaxID=2320716 RepID=A0AAP0AS76_9ASPA